MGSRLVPFGIGSHRKMLADTRRGISPNPDACVSMCASYHAILGNSQWRPRCESPFSTEGNEMKGSAFGLLVFILFFDWLRSSSPGFHGAISERKVRMTALNSTWICGLGSRYASNSEIITEVLSYFCTRFCPIGLQLCNMFCSAVFSGYVVENMCLGRLDYSTNSTILCTLLYVRALAYFILTFE